MIIEGLLTATIFCLLGIIHLHSRRIDRVHERISLTTRMNGLKDPWRDAEERSEMSRPASNSEAK